MRPRPAKFALTEREVIAHLVQGPGCRDALVHRGRDQLWFHEQLEPGGEGQDRHEDEYFLTSGNLIRSGRLPDVGAIEARRLQDLI